MKPILLLTACLLTWPAEASEVPAARAKARAKAPAVKAYVAREAEPICTKGPVAVVGSQYLNEPGAEESAQKAWHEAVRFHYGEAYMDLARAKEYRHRCSRSSIGEVVGQTMHRCEVSAIPCKPAMTSDK